MLIGNNHTSQNTRRALTLVELTVVTVALAGLIGATLPTVRSAHDKSLEAGCRERLGKIAQAGLVYAAEDPGELAIPIGVGDAQTPEVYASYWGYGGKTGLGHTLNANTSIFGGSNFFKMGTMDRPLNRILYKKPFAPPQLICSGRGGCQQNWNDDARRDLDVYHCPADNGFPGMHYRGWKDSQLSGYDYFGTSYSAMPLFITHSPFGGYLESLSIYGRPVSRVPNPSRTILYEEAAARFAIFATNPELPQTGGFWPFPIGDLTANGWHGTPFRFNISFADSHVENIEIKGYGTSPVPDFMPCGAGCASAMVRGPGWQIDTFPAPLVPTVKISLGGNGDGNTSSTWGVVQ